MKRRLVFSLVFLVIFLLVWLWIIPAKIKSDQPGHEKYLDRQGYELVERTRVRAWSYSAFYSVVDKETMVTDTVEVRYSKNGSYNIVY